MARETLRQLWQAEHFGDPAWRVSPWRVSPIEGGSLGRLERPAVAYFWPRPCSQGRGSDKLHYGWTAMNNHPRTDMAAIKIGAVSMIAPYFRQPICVQP